MVCWKKFKLQKILENNINPDIVYILKTDIDDLEDSRKMILDFYFESLSSYIYGIETFDMLDNQRLLNERKLKLEIMLVKLEKDKDNIKNNSKLSREHKIEIVRQYLYIIKSYENALKLLSA